MDILKKIVGIILLVVAVVVAVHTIVEPLYFDSSRSGSGYSEGVWGIINYFSALTVILGLIFGYMRKRDADAADETTVTREFLTANTIFFGFLFIGIMFFWNWFNLLSPAFNAVGPDAVSLAWIIIDAGLPLLAGALGVHLLLAGTEE